MARCLTPQTQSTLQEVSPLKIWTIQGPETNITSNILIVTPLSDEDS